nr:hypothetical protein [Tanacetum cinerariifolium]GEW78437.1 hypothetical protein [Tanacetum cinerariifolium]
MDYTSSSSSSSSSSDSEKAKKEIDELKLTLEKYQHSFKSLNTLLECQVSDKIKTRLGYKAASPAKESCVKSSEMLENQKNVKSRSHKGYYAVLPPYTGNYIPPKPDLMFIDEQFKSESVDVVSIVSSSVVKTVESKVKFVDVKNKGVYSTVETKTVRKNSFSPPIIEDWNSDDESEVEFKIKIEYKTDRVLDLEKIKTDQANEIVDLKKRVKKLERKRRSRTRGMNLFGTYRRRFGKEDASKQERNLKQGSIFEESDFDVQAMMDANYELAARLRAEEERRKPLTKTQKKNQI